jgi:hypothetical protein
MGDRYVNFLDCFALAAWYCSASGISLCLAHPSGFVRRTFSPDTKQGVETMRYLVLTTVLTAALLTGCTSTFEVSSLNLDLADELARQTRLDESLRPSVEPEVIAQRDFAPDTERNSRTRASEASNH